MQPPLYASSQHSSPDPADLPPTPAPPRYTLGCLMLLSLCSCCSSLPGIPFLLPILTPHWILPHCLGILLDITPSRRAFPTPNLIRFFLCANHPTTTTTTEPHNLSPLCTVLSPQSVTNSRAGPMCPHSASPRKECRLGVNE